MPMLLSKPDLQAVFIASQAPLHRFLTRYLGCPDIASDLVQDLYLRLDRMPSVSDTAEARARLFRVATGPPEAPPPPRRAAQDSLDRYFGGSHPPEDVVLGQEQIRMMQAALAELPSLCAEVVFLSRVEELTHGAIAKRLGVSKSLVEKHVMRALNHCRRMLGIEARWGGRRVLPAASAALLDDCGIHAPHSL